jgi:hypothetical protein
MPNNSLERWVLPAVDAVYEGDGVYRCERDLHHHLTALFEKIESLRIGSFERLAEYEHPTIGKYQWTGESDSSGNVDIYFFPRQENGERLADVAIEVNYNYKSLDKIKQDIIKLIDPLNNYSQGVYVACGETCGFKEAVVTGVQRAFEWFYEDDPTFTLPPGLLLLVIENCRGRRTFWKGICTAPCSPSSINWSSRSRDRVSEGLHARLAAEGGRDLLSREEAKELLRQAMIEAGIPLTSKTAKCMFETTTDSTGANNCKHGRTPLWDEELPKIDDKVLRAIFLDWVEKLRASGLRSQEATNRRFR